MPLFLSGEEKQISPSLDFYKQILIFTYFSLEVFFSSFFFPEEI